MYACPRTARTKNWEIFREVSRETRSITYLYVCSTGPLKFVKSPLTDKTPGSYPLTSTHIFFICSSKHLFWTPPELGDAALAFNLAKTKWMADSEPLRQVDVCLWNKGNKWEWCRRLPFHYKSLNMAWWWKLMGGKIVAGVALCLPDKQWLIQSRCWHRGFADRGKGSMCGEDQLKVGHKQLRGYILRLWPTSPLQSSGYFILFGPFPCRCPFMLQTERETSSCKLFLEECIVSAHLKNSGRTCDDGSQKAVSEWSVVQRARGNSSGV